jgi:glucosamine-6-phosphate deaminase
MPSAARALDHAGARIEIFDTPAAACADAASRIASVVEQAVAARGRVVLGLATGSTPIPVYRHLVERHQAGTLSFARAITYNLDEYYPIGPCDPQSYRWFMHQHLFQRIDLPPNQAHVLDGTVPEAAIADHCATFDHWIAADGGLDLQLLGIGRNGHIGFNEPSGLALESFCALPTRLAELHPVTREDAVRDFGGEVDRVPRRALTVGVAPILAARSVLILAFGARKAAIVAAALEGPVTPEVPASVLRTIPGRVTWLLDTEAAAGLGG